jgi:hypothetical protein
LKWVSIFTFSSFYTAHVVILFILSRILRAQIFFNFTGQCESAIELCKEALAVGEENRASFEDKAKVFQRVAGAYVKLNNIPAALDGKTSK